MNQSGQAAVAAILLDDVHLKLTSAAGEVNILRGIDLSVAAGEAIGVIGPSGGGKSTMMMVIAGLEKITSGRVCTAGVELNGLDEDALARFRRDSVGVVFQDFHLIPTMTAHENVAVPLELAGRRDAMDAARAALDAAGLDERSGHYPAQLSGGEQQRVAIARAFAGEPALVLADEPTGNLDTRTGAAIVDLMFDTQARLGSTLLLITHDKTIAARCARHYRMDDGVILLASPQSDIRAVPSA